MRTLVVGAGATGCFYGGALAQVGRRVTFFARGRGLEALRTSGLTLRLADGTQTLVVEASDDPVAIGVVDAVLFCVKAYQLEFAARSVERCIGAGTLVIPVQNGIGSAETLRVLFPQAHVVGGVARTFARTLSPGVVEHQGIGTLTVGELSGSPSSALTEFAGLFAGAKATCKVVDDIETDLWTKFVHMCGLAGTTTATRLTLGEILACAPSRELCRGLIAEASELAAASKVRLARSPDEIVAGLEKAPASSRSSMYDDLLAGRPLEIDVLNGAAVRLGKALGVSVPLNAAINGVLAPHAAGRRAPTSSDHAGA